MLFDKSRNMDIEFFYIIFWEDILKNGSRNEFKNLKKLYYKKLGFIFLLVIKIIRNSNSKAVITVNIEVNEC